MTVRLNGLHPTARRARRTAAPRALGLVAGGGSSPQPSGGWCAGRWARSKPCICRNPEGARRMAFESLNDLLKMAEQALERNDQRAAGMLIKRVIERDFVNIGAWQLLHRLVGSDQPFETFQQTFAQKYYPERAHLLKPIVERALSESKSQSQTFAIQRSTKKCPYCAEMILAEATICRFCGRDLTQEPPEVLSRRRVELTRKLAQLEKTLMSWERYLQEQAQLEDEAKRQITWAWLGVFVGIFLIPVVIGLILVPAGILAAITQGEKRSKARRNQSKARESIEITQKIIVDVRAALAAFQ